MLVGLFSLLLISFHWYTVNTNTHCCSTACFFTFSIVPGRLSGDKTIVERLVNAGLFAALIAQSKTQDRNTKERCVVTISLMADADTHIREALVGGSYYFVGVFCCCAC